MAESPHNDAARLNIVGNLRIARNRASHGCFGGARCPTLTGAQWPARQLDVSALSGTVAPWWVCRQLPVQMVMACSNELQIPSAVIRYLQNE